MSRHRRIFEDQLYAHFITFSCYRRRKHLSHDRIRKILIAGLNSQLNQQNATCIGFVIMLEHVHVLLKFDKPDSLSGFMREWKRRTSFFSKRFFSEHAANYCKTFPISDPFWETRYYDFPIEDEDKLHEKLKYIHQNPVRANLVETPSDWKWSSARWYEHRRSVGVSITWPGQ